MAAEIHIIGSVDCATGFPSNRLFCKWNLEIGYDFIKLNRFIKITKVWMWMNHK